MRGEYLTMWRFRFIGGLDDTADLPLKIGGYVDNRGNQAISPIPSPAGKLIVAFVADEAQ